MKIDALKKKYKAEWLAIEVTKQKDGKSIEGKLVLHEKDRDDLWKKLSPKKDAKIYVTYAGPPIKEGYGVAF